MFVKSLLPIGFLALANAKPSPANDLKPLASTDATLLTLGDIDGETANDLSIVTVRLDQVPPWQSVGPMQNHGSFFQLTLPSTIVPEPGKFYDAGNPFLPKVGAFQVSPSDAAIRLFTSPEFDATALAKALKAEVLGSRIVISVDHSLVPRPQQSRKKDVVGPPHPAEKITADQIIANTTVREDIPAPADIVKSSLTGAPPTTRLYLTKLATVGAFLTLLILASIGLRGFVRKKGQALQRLDPGIALKTIASMSLAPRQKVSVIQVGHEKILLGITPDSITFLTSLSSQDSGRAGAAQVTPKSTPQLPSANDEPVEKPTRKTAALPQGRDFSDLMNDSSQTLSLKAAPRLKQITGNDEQTLRQSARPEQTPNLDLPSTKATRPIKTTTGNRINIGVGEEGITPMPRRRDAAQPKTPSKPNQETIDDVTRLIREKLKNLKSI